MKIAVRSMLTAGKDHYYLSVDLSQAEAWVVAYMADEPTMKRELQYGDIHTRTARAVLNLQDENIPIKDEERYTGKKCNHAFNYLMGPERACEVINKEGQIVVTTRQTKLYRKRYLELYRIEGWWLDVENQLRDRNCLTTPYGFRRKFYGSGKERVKEGVAFIPQSTIADHMYGRVQPGGVAGGLRLVNERIISKNKALKLVHSAHDSCIIRFPRTIDVKELYADVRSYLRRPMVINGEEFTIPCDAKYGEHWEEFEKIKEAA